jgi:hypothetical protein
MAENVKLSGSCTTIMGRESYTVTGEKADISKKGTGTLTVAGRPGIAGTSFTDTYDVASGKKTGSVNSLLGKVDPTGPDMWRSVKLNQCATDMFRRYGDKSAIAQMVRDLAGAR